MTNELRIELNSFPQERLAAMVEANDMDPQGKSKDELVAMLMEQAKKDLPESAFTTDHGDT